MVSSRKNCTPILHFLIGSLGCFLTSFTLAQSNDSPNDSAYTNTHIFNNYGNLKSSQQQAILLNEKGPAPFSIFSSVQKWTTGPKLDNLYTEMAQGLYKVNDQWKIVASELYQKQGNIHLSNTGLGVNYLPNEDWSINAFAGAGAGVLYTYQYSLLLSPQYKLPITSDGKKTVSIEADVNYQEYALGNFRQFAPKINWQASDMMPPISFGYAFGSFQNSTSISANQYYQPKTANGAMISTSLRINEKSFLIITYYPYNKNIIGGFQVIQDTIGATFDYKLTDKLHLSLFSQYQNARNISIDIAFGGALNFSF